MQPISGLLSAAARSPAPISGVKDPPKVQRPENQLQERSLKPVMDEYVPDVDGPEKKASKDRAVNCTCNTDRVDRELEGLKREQEELKRQINSETDDTELRELEQKLARIESELGRKDSDMYRRQKAVFS